MVKWEVGCMRNRGSTLSEILLYTLLKKKNKVVEAMYGIIYYKFDMISKSVDFK